MKPRNWKPGESVSATKLNQTNTEASRPRRQFSIGSGSSMVNETMGNQSSSSHQPVGMLVIAKEDFAPQDSETDIYGINDPQFSGLCMMMRLNSSGAAPSGEYEEEENAKEFRVWDPLALLTNASSKLEGDIFYILYNKDSKRWEVISTSSSVRLTKAIVICCLGNGWHKVELTDWNEIPDETSCSVSASVSDDDCDLCWSDSVSVSVSDEVCLSEDIEITRDVGTPTGEFAYAHTTRLSPMMVGGLIKMLRRIVPDSVSVSVSDEPGDIYDVVDGVWPLISLPFPEYECIDDEVVMVQCNKAIVEGYWCQDGSGSD